MTSNVDVTRPVPSSSGRAGGDVGPNSGLTRGEPAAVSHGRSGLARDSSRLFDYDRIEGFATGSDYRAETDVADRATVAQAKAELMRIHQLYGIEREQPGFLVAWDREFFICYALNGASQVAPNERVGFTLIGEGGQRFHYDYQPAADILGVGARRFYRAFADEIVDVCNRLYFNVDTEDELQVEQRALMVALADKRGISRFPWLVADCADAALRISPSQRAAVLLSKASVIAASTNAVDSRNLAKPIRSADNYDSSNHRSVPMANDIHGTQYYS